MMIVFSDLDGTFLTSRKQIPARNLEALGALAAEGIPFVPCSGRALTGILQSILEHPATRYAISTNGAVVIDITTGKALRRADLGQERALDLFEIARGHDVTFDIFASGRIYTRRDVFDRFNGFVSDTLLLASMRAMRTPYDGDTAELLRTLDHIERVSLYWRDPADRDALLAEIKRVPDVSCVRSYPTNFEISDARATKGAALAWLCDHLGIPLGEAVSFGDNLNDVSMIEKAGTGVAMENAEPEIKAIADAITLTNDEGGVGEFILQRLADNR